MLPILYATFAFAQTNPVAGGVCDLVRAEGAEPLPNCGKLLSPTPSPDVIASGLKQLITGSSNAEGAAQLVDLALGVQGEPFNCFETQKYGKITLPCASGGKAHINFVAFGNPTGKCGAYEQGTCTGPEALDRLANHVGFFKYAWASACPNVIGPIVCSGAGGGQQRLVIEYTCCDALPCLLQPVGSMNQPTLPPTASPAEGSAYAYAKAAKMATPDQVKASLGAEGVGASSVEVVVAAAKVDTYSVTGSYQINGQDAARLDHGKFCAGITSFACVEHPCTCRIVSATDRKRRRLAALARRLFASVAAVTTAAAAEPVCANCAVTVAFELTAITHDQYLPTAWWGISYAAAALVLHFGAAIVWLLLLFCECRTPLGCCGATCAKPAFDSCRRRTNGCDCGARDAVDAYGDGPVAAAVDGAPQPSDKRPIADRCVPAPAWALVPVAVATIAVALLALILISIAMGPAEYQGKALSMRVPGASYSATLAVFEAVAIIFATFIAALSLVVTFVPHKDGESCAATTCQQSTTTISHSCVGCGKLCDIVAKVLRSTLVATLTSALLFFSATSILIVLLCAQMFIGRPGFELLHVVALFTGHIVCALLQLAAQLALWRGCGGKKRICKSCNCSSSKEDEKAGAAGAKPKVKANVQKTTKAKAKHSPASKKEGATKSAGKPPSIPASAHRGGGAKRKGGGGKKKRHGAGLSAHV